jgi:hypothetical protein
MTDAAAFVLDTSVISSFHAVEWLDGIACWTPQYSLVAPARVWDEFADYWDVEQPSWLEIRDVPLEGEEVNAPGALSVPDWACVLLAERVDGVVVTNDQAMHTVAESREVPWTWGTAFCLETFDRCGISQEELDAGIEGYAADLGLSHEIVSVLDDAEK